MKYTIELTDDDAHGKLQMYMMCEGMWHTLWDFDQWMRNEIKYSNKSGEHLEGVEAARDKLHDIMNEHGVNLERVE